MIFDKSNRDYDSIVFINDTYNRDYLKLLYRSITTNYFSIIMTNSRFPQNLEIEGSSVVKWPSKTNKNVLYDGSPPPLGKTQPITNTRFIWMITHCCFTCYDKYDRHLTFPHWSPVMVTAYLPRYTCRMNTPSRSNGSLLPSAPLGSDRKSNIYRAYVVQQIF